MLGKVAIGLLVAAGLFLVYMLFAGRAQAGSKDSGGGWNYSNVDKEWLDQYAARGPTPEQGAARGRARSAASAAASARKRM